MITSFKLYVVSGHSPRLAWEGFARFTDLEMLLCTLFLLGPEDRRGFFSPPRPTVSTSIRPPRASRSASKWWGRSVVAALLLNIPTHFRETVISAGVATFTTSSPPRQLLGAQRATL